MSDQPKSSDQMVGGIDRHRFDNPREAKRHDNYREPRYMECERFRYKDDVIHNVFGGRGGNNAHSEHYLKGEGQRTHIFLLDSRYEGLL